MSYEAAFFPFDVRYLFRCGYCSAHVEQARSVWPGAAIPRPALPDGWQVVARRLMCSRHQVKVEITSVDGA